MSAPEYEIWGLTGGVASGKSTVARLFEELGIPVVDADQVARDLSAPGGAAYQAIVKRFGTDDRAKLREIIFADSAARRDLEEILHPLIRSESLKRVSQAAKGALKRGMKAPVIYEAALLVESGRYRDMAGLIVVEAPEAARQARLVARDRIGDSLAAQMIASQLSDAERRKAATLVLENRGDVDELRRKVRELALARGWIR